MVLYPAIDILDGRAVRLYKGDKNKVTDYGDPLAFAGKWAEAGAEWLHIVDLSGAFTGESGIDSVIAEIKKRFPQLRIQSGGGLRRIADIRRRLNAGADCAVIGTMAAYDPDEFALATYEFPEKIVAGIDAKGGMFAVKGWTETTNISAVTFGKKYKKMGIRCALFTDIAKDGAMAGANVSETVRMQKETELNIIASGGISSMKDLENLEEAGVYGAVLGKAIYSGAIDLKEAVRRFPQP